LEAPEVGTMTDLLNTAWKWTIEQREKLDDYVVSNWLR